MENKDAVGKYFILRDLHFSDFMRDENDNLKMHDDLEYACNTCGINEWPNVLVCKVEYNHVEPGETWEEWDPTPQKSRLQRELRKFYKDLLVKNSKWQNGDDDYAPSTNEMRIIDALNIILKDLKD